MREYKCGVCGSQDRDKLIGPKENPENLCLSCMVWSHHEINYLAFKHSTGSPLFRLPVTNYWRW